MNDTIDLRERIQSSYHRLRPSEQLVADYLSQTAGQRLDVSITDLARRIGVSEATVSRVSKALGFQGYPDMKLSIAAASSAAYRAANIPAELAWSDSAPEIGRKLAEAVSRSLVETEQLIDPRQLERSIEAMLAARKVVFMGVGGAGPICDEAAHVFLKIGLDAASYADAYTQTVVASTLKPDSLLVGISHTGTTPSVVAALRLARDNGAGTIAITGDDGSDLARAASTVFVTTRRARGQVPLMGDFLEARLCQLFLIDVLYLGVMFRLAGAARDTLDVTTRALAAQFSPPAPARGGPKPRKRGTGAAPRPGERSRDS